MTPGEASNDGRTAPARAASGPAGAEERILLLAPIGRDAGLVSGALAGAGFRVEVCRGMPDLCRRLDAGAGAAVIAKEALTEPALRTLDHCLSGQPRWSRLPMVILTRTGQTDPDDLQRIRSLQSMATATLLERPFRVVTLVSGAHVALERRRAQYEIRDHLQERAEREAELRRREQELSRLNAELEDRVAARTRQLEWANERLRDEIVERKELERKVAGLSVGAQHRIRGELHESIAQQITALAFLASSIKRKLDRGDRPRDEQVDLLNRSLDEMKVQIGRVMRGLTPVEVDAEGLMLALGDLARQTCELHAIDARLECPRPVHVQDNFTATQLYHIAEEAVRNAVAHGSAVWLTVRLQARGGGIELGIEYLRGSPEDGAPRSDAAFESGLRIIRYRCDLIGAECAFHSADGRAGRVVCTLRERS